MILLLLLLLTLWLLIIINFLIISFYYSFSTWNEALEKQTVTVPDTPNHPISNYIFPAVTICNFNVISKSRAFITSKKLNMFQNLTLQELTDKLYLMKHLTDIPCSPSIHKDLHRLHDILDSNSIEAASLLKYLSPTCKEMMERCTWKGQHTACEHLFQTIATPFGFCCSFNYFGFKEDVKNSTDNTYKTLSKTPRRVSATGYLTALETVVNSVTADYFATTLPSYGHTITVHFPYNFPDRNSQMLLQYIQGLILISVNPSLYRTDVNVNSLDMDKRNCAFIGEKRLEYFVYTYYNCMSECRANLIKRFCGCVPFYYLQFYENSLFKSARVCNLRDVICIEESKERIYKLHSICSCLHDCNYIKYTIEGSFSVFTKQFVNQKPALYGGVKLNNQSVIRIFFDDLVSTRYTTSLIHYWHTVLGRIGGVLGLLIGFSTTSIIEIIYFFILRPIVDILFQYRIIFLYLKGGYK